MADTKPADKLGLVITGFNAIASVLYGADPKGPRRVERLASEVAEPERLPTFKLAGNVCIRTERLLTWIEERERASQGGEAA